MKKTTTYLRILQMGGMLMLLLCCGAFGARAQADAPVMKAWDKTYGGTGNDKLQAIVATADGGFLLGGYSDSNAGFEKSEDAHEADQRGRMDYWVVKVDAEGRKLWDKTYGGNGNDQLYAVVSTPDGGFLLGGESSSFSSHDKSEDPRGGYDYWIVRIDAQGNKLWDKTYGGRNDDNLYDILPTPDGGYVLGGGSWSPASFDKTDDWRDMGKDYWIIRIDAQGNKLWDKTYGGSHTDYFRAIVPADNGGYLVAGTSHSYASFDKSEDLRGGLTDSTDSRHRSDFWLVRIDEQGDILWDKAYGGSFSDELNTVTPTEDGGFLLGGRSDSKADFDKSENSRRGTDYWLVKIDAQGNKLWDKTYGSGDHDDLYGVSLASDGGFLIGGASDSNAGYDKSEDRRGRWYKEDIWVVRTDAEGNKLWDKTYGSASRDYLSAICRAANHGFILGVGTDSDASYDKSENARGMRDFWILKINDLLANHALFNCSPRARAAPGLATLDLYGTPFNENSAVTLFRAGQTKMPERYTMRSQYKAQCLFDFAEEDLGLWSVAVTFNDTLSDTLFDALTVEELEPFAPCVQIAGQPEARAERWNTYHFAVSNTSNGDRQGVPVWIALPDTGAEYEISFQIAGGNPLDDAWQDLQIDWNALSGPVSQNPNVLPLYLPYLPAGKTMGLRVRVKADFGNENFKLRAWTNSLMSGEDFGRHGLNCLYVALAAIGAEAVPDVVSEIGTLEAWRQCAAQAALDVQRDLRLLTLDWHSQPRTTVMTQQQFYYAAARRIFDCMNYSLDAQQQENLAGAVNAMLNYGNLVAKAKPTKYERCAMLGLGIDQNNFPCFQRELLINFDERNGIDADRDSTLSEAEAEFMQALTEPCLHASYLFSPVCEAKLEVEVVNSYDPNNKVGVKGAGANGYLPELQPFKYVINYENKPDATAPAQEVFIYDTLDAETFDLATFRFGAVGFGDTIAEPVVYPDSMKVDIDLRPEQPYIVRVTGKLNRSFHSAMWHFETLDPETMELIADPRGGFLPPNQTSPEGQGFVFFTVEPKGELQSGAEIRNDAKIVFDLNPPIFTEPWINTLDQDLPESVAAAERASDTTIALNWNGADRTSGVAHYTIYMSVDDSAYAPILWQTTELAAEISADPDHAYRFYSIATDVANNVEPTPEIADATLFVVSRAEDFAASESLTASARPNPFSGQTTFAIELTKPARLELEIRDLSGRLVAAETFDAPGGQSEHTFDASALSAGAYFYTIRAQDGRRAAGKLVVK